MHTGWNMQVACALRHVPLQLTQPKSPALATRRRARPDLPAPKEPSPFNFTARPAPKPAARCASLRCLSLLFAHRKCDFYKCGHTDMCSPSSIAGVPQMHELAGFRLVWSQVIRFSNTAVLSTEL